jgi:hypothetical protein
MTMYETIRRKRRLLNIQNIIPHLVGKPGTNAT